MGVPWTQQNESGWLSTCLQGSEQFAETFSVLDTGQWEMGLGTFVWHLLKHIFIFLCIFFRTAVCYSVVYKRTKLHVSCYKCRGKWGSLATRVLVTWILWAWLSTLTSALFWQISWWWVTPPPCVYITMKNHGHVWCDVWRKTLEVFLEVTVLWRFVVWTVWAWCVLLTVQDLLDLTAIKHDLRPTLLKALQFFLPCFVYQTYTIEDVSFCLFCSSCFVWCKWQKLNKEGGCSQCWCILHLPKYLLGKQV